MNKATKAISLVLVGSGAVLLGYTAFRPRTPSYYSGGSSTQPSSYHGSHGGYHRGGGFVPVPYRSGRGYSGSSGYGGSSYSGSSSHSSGSYSGSSHSSGTSRGGFGSSGRSSGT